MDSVTHLTIEELSQITGLDRNVLWEIDQDVSRYRSVRIGAAQKRKAKEDEAWALRCSDVHWEKRHAALHTEEGLIATARRVVAGAKYVDLAKELGTTPGYVSAAMRFLDGMYSWDWDNRNSGLDYPVWERRGRKEMLARALERFLAIEPSVPDEYRQAIPEGEFEARRENCRESIDPICRISPLARRHQNEATSPPHQGVSVGYL